MEPRAAADVAGAHQSAVVERADGNRPFTQLRRLYTTMCWCTPAAVWHALLSLLRWAVHLHHAESLSTNDPLTVAALDYLPSLTSLGADCLWPGSFATFMMSRSEQTDHYRYLASSEVSGEQSSDCPE